MPSATMRALNEKRRQMLDSQAQDERADNTEIENTDNVQPDEVDNHDEENQQENLPDENPDESTEDEGGESNPEPAKDDYERKFKRLSGKMGKVERERNEAKQRAKELEERLAELKAREKLEAEMKAKNKSQDDDFDDDYDYEWGRDEPKEKSKGKKKADDIEVEKEVERILAEKEKQKRHSIFNQKLDEELKDLGEESSFIELVNEPDFDKFIMSNRARKALFADSAQHQDDEAIQIMKNLVREYLGKNKVVENKTTPNVKNTSKRPPKKQENLITEEEYLRAIRDKGVASKRKRANEIIAAYHKQQNS